jgi:hypothetical protein
LILLSHAHDQLRDVTHDAGRSHASSLNKVPLLRNQPLVPSQQRIRRNDGVELEQGLSAQSFGLARQQSALGVGEADAPPSEPAPEQPVSA